MRHQPCTNLGNYRGRISAFLNSFTRPLPALSLSRSTSPCPCVSLDLGEMSLNAQHVSSVTSSSSARESLLAVFDSMHYQMHCVSAFMNVWQKRHHSRLLESLYCYQYDDDKSMGGRSLGPPKWGALGKAQDRPSAAI